MTARRSEAARPRRQPVRPSRLRTELGTLGRKPWGRPKREWAGSTKVPSALVTSVPQAREAGVQPRPALPMRVPGRRAGARAARRLKAPALPRWARPLQAATPALALPSSGRVPPEGPEIPRSEEVREPPLERVAEPRLRASPTWVQGLQVAHRARPRLAR
jgi:hypothetical protein